MKSLFLRIFLSFWVALALFMVMAILVTLAFRPRSSTWEALRTTVLNDSVSAYEEGGGPQLRRFGWPQVDRACRATDSFSPRRPCRATRARLPTANIATRWFWDCRPGRG